MSRGLIFRYKKLILRTKLFGSMYKRMITIWLMIAAAALLAHAVVPHCHHTARYSSLEQLASDAGCGHHHSGHQHTGGNHNCQLGASSPASLEKLLPPGLQVCAIAFPASEYSGMPTPPAPVRLIAFAAQAPHAQKGVGTACGLRAPPCH